MKTKIDLRGVFYALGATLVLASCQKSNELTATTGSTTSSTSPTIAVAATQASSSTQRVTDSVYVLQPCPRGGHRDSIAQADLPSAVTSYINANYGGSSFAKAFALKDASASVTGYVVVIYYNDKPVAIQFDSTGAFVKVLEQREKGDLDGPGHHDGGRFEHRDGRQRDTIALSALPSAIVAYFATNNATDTLLKAFRNKDGSIVVLSKNSGLYATVFATNGSFIKRELLPAKEGKIQSIELASVPSVAANYLSQTYPNYVFEKAFSVSQNGSVKGYVVVIDANNTKYAVAFDTSGNVVKTMTIR